MRRSLAIAAIIMIISSFGLATRSARAVCQPEPGTGSSTDDLVVCDGDDADGVNVGSGNDEVQIISGTVLDSIISEGGTVLIVINGGALNTLSAGHDAIFVDGSGNVIFQGSLIAGGTGIYIVFNGNVTSTGDISASDFGIYIGGNGNVISTGTITSATAGIHLGGDGDVTSTGDVSGDVTGIVILGNGDVDSIGEVIGGNYGIVILGNGDVASTGDVGGTLYGILVGGDGSVTSTGDVSSSAFGIYLASNGKIISSGNVSGLLYGLYVGGNGSITSSGNVTSAFLAIYVVGDGDVTSTGDLSGTAGIVVDGNGNISSTGAINGIYAGIHLEGDGNVNVVGSITAGDVGIEGGPGAQHVDVNGSIDAPVAVRLGDGNDSLYIHSDSTLSSAIQMDGGDDTVIVGDYAVVLNTIFGGETGELFGDRILIGDGQICSEDGAAVAMARGINALNPDAGTVTYLGQTYTWAEFEHIATAAHFAPCVGSIHDGRINAYDLGAPDALYCVQGGGESVWEIDLDGQGTYSFYVTTAQVNSAFDQAVASGINQSIGSDDLGNIFYALSDGHTIAFFAPELREPDKTYQFTFERERCPVS